MAWKMKTDGLEDVEKMLGQMAEKAHGVAAGALYEGAGIMAAEVQKSAGQISTAPFKYTRDGTRMPSPEEKEIVLNASAGVAKFGDSNGGVDTSVGYRNAGYAELAGKTRPIPVIVNSINSGTSFMKKQPFVRKAAATGSTKAVAKMKAYIEDAFDKMNK